MFSSKAVISRRNSIALVTVLWAQSMLFDQRHAAVIKGTQHVLQASSTHVTLTFCTLCIPMWVKKQPSGPPPVTALLPWQIQMLCK